MLWRYYSDSQTGGLLTLPERVITFPFGGEFSLFFHKFLNFDIIIFANRAIFVIDSFLKRFFGLHAFGSAWALVGMCLGRCLEKNSQSNK